MQKYLFFILPVFACNCAYGQALKDSIAIVRLLEKEAATWRSGDIKAHADCWQLRPYSRILVSTGDGGNVDVPPAVVVNPPASMVGGGGRAAFSNIKMSIQRKNAWVSHDEVSTAKDGKQTFSREIRILEKVKGQWKLVGQSIHIYQPAAAMPIQGNSDTTSYIQTLDIATGKIDTVLTIRAHFEAPNWHPDHYLIVNSLGKLYTLDLNTKKLALLPTGFANQCNNDHGISPDKKWLVVSHNDKRDTSSKSYKSAIYILPIQGGQPRRVTPEVMSFWHGWTPDGKTLAYCAERNGNYDVYSIGVEGGREKRLTDATGLDDGPDYSPDGKYIYFNSYRTGHMHLWRMLADGSQPEQLTFDENSNWFPHPSPDNQWIAYIAYTSDEKQAHLFGKNVKLRLMDLKTKAIRDLTPVFYGGQGTINVPSWSPDSKKIAFVSYWVKK
jgi:Tol biopolymer transport system component